MLSLRLFFLVLLLVLIGSCSSSTKIGADSSSLTRLPYLQMAYADSVTILWRSPIGINSSLRFRPADSTVRWQTIKPKQRRTNTEQLEHEAVLQQLQAATKYHYQILLNGQAFLDTLFSFHSAILPTDSSFNFFAVGDIGEAVEVEGKPDRLAQSLIQSPLRYDFGLLLGDIVYPNGESMHYDTHFFQHFKTYLSATPVYTILGNHDWNEPQNNYMQEWKLPGNEHYYSFRYGNCQFIAVDSGPRGEIYEYPTQKAWLEAELKAAQGKVDWVVVFLHHNGKSCTYKRDEPAVMSLYPLFEAYQVDLVFNGHAHTYERLHPMDGNGTPTPTDFSATTNYHQPKGFISITIGSGGKLRGELSDPTPFTPNPSDCRHPNLVAQYAHECAYLGLELQGRRLKATAYHTSTGQVIDQFFIQK